MADRSRRPHSSPSLSSDELESSVLRLHDQYDCWGSRKLQTLLPQETGLPHPSTIDANLRRHGRQMHGSIKRPEDTVLKVRENGHIMLKKHECFVGERLIGHEIALRATDLDGVYKVYFCGAELQEIDMTKFG